MSDQKLPPDSYALKLQVTCCICGVVETLQWNDETNQELSDNQMCFTDNFWREKTTWLDREDTKDRVVRVNHVHYMLGAEKREKGQFGFRGFGGSRFKIQFHDGREVESTNLWTQGNIPERWRDQLPDNAVFVQNTEPYGGTMANPTSKDGKRLPA